MHDDRFDRIARTVSRGDARHGMIHRLSRLLSRRSLVGGTLGAALLAATGGEAARARVTAERCVPAGRRCGTRPTDQPCDECCQRYFVVTKKGSKKCACRPVGTACHNHPLQCCSGICEKGVCRSAPCRKTGTNCEVDADCCSGVCGTVSVFSPTIGFKFCRRVTCQPPGGECQRDVDCCTELCFEGTCEDP